MLSVKKLLTKVLSRFGTDVTVVNAENGITGELRVVKDRASGTVRCYGYYRRNTDINTSTTIYTIPAAYRPKSDMFVPMFIYTSGGVCAAYFGIVHTNGTINQLLGGTIREGYVSGEWSI